MKPRPRLVLDTNIWVSAFLARGPPSEIVQMAEERLVEVFVSLEMLDEINRVLQYEKIVGILKRSRTRSSTVMGTITRLSSIVDVKAEVRVIKEDPSDNHVLACAKEVDAQFIVSGDHHLLTLGGYGNTRILGASAFLQIQRARRRRKN
ncbi:MAG: putative toxin-antitoxin system toxin component, PIN family [Candidatus Bathyarchaeia archaeon]|jgi:putative PIN family toxin of toxin-antitoxin system